MHRYPGGGEANGVDCAAFSGNCNGVHARFDGAHRAEISLDEMRAVIGNDGLDVISVGPASNDMVEGDLAMMRLTADVSADGALPVAGEVIRAQLERDARFDADRPDARRVTPPLSRWEYVEVDGVGILEIALPRAMMDETDSDIAAPLRRASTYQSMRPRRQRAPKVSKQLAEPLFTEG